MAGHMRDVDRLSVTGVLSGVIEQMVQQAVDDRLQRLEARMSSLEERVTSLQALERSEAAGGQGALEQLEARMCSLEEGLQRALARVFPRVEALVARLETPSASAPPDRGATTAPPAADGEQSARREVLRRMQVVKTRMYRSGVAPSATNEELCKATSAGNVNDVRRLLASGADVNYTNCRGKSPLLSAFSAMISRDVVSLLVDRGADVNAVDPVGLSALHYAAARGRCVALLITVGAIVNARDGFGRTPLHFAALHGKATAVRALLSAGANTRHRVWSGRGKNKMAFDFAKSHDIQRLFHQ